MNERPANIETERLLLVCLLPEEIESMVAGNHEHASVLTGLFFRPDDPKLGVDWSWHLRAIQADYNQLPWRIRVIAERSSRIVIGSINLKGPPINGDVEIGWGLNAEARGRGYATEAAAAVMTWAAQNAAVVSISATVPDDNYPSQRVATRLGLSRTNQTRRDTPLWTFRLG